MATDLTLELEPNVHGKEERKVLNELKQVRPHNASHFLRRLRPQLSTVDSRTAAVAVHSVCRRKNLRSVADIGIWICFPPQKSRVPLNSLLQLLKSSELSSVKAAPAVP